MTTQEHNAAIKAAFARVNGDVVLIWTLSLYYDGLVDGDGNANELYIYDGGSAEGYVEYDDYDVGYRDCIIEAEANVNGGQIARFVNLPFKIELPPENDKGGRRASLQISNINREISRNARAAVVAGKKIYVTFRGYILGAEKLEIAHKALKFQVKKIDLSGAMASIELIADAPNLVNVKFPKKTYNLDDWPFMRGRSQKVGD